MRVTFACPSCAAKGSADSIHVGKSVRCRHCGADFAIPRPDGDEPDVYALEESADAPARWVPEDAGQQAVFVPARREPREPRGGTRPTPTRSRPRRDEPEFPWAAWLIGGGVGLAVVLLLIALLAPNGLWLSGCILLALGGLMVLIGFAAGAYGAFHEDVIYGLLYLAVPLYTAYYMVTRWEDLWAWFTCSTVGVGLVLLGTELIRWAGAPV